MIFSENFLPVEMTFLSGNDFLEWKWALTLRKFVNFCFKEIFSTLHPNITDINF